jgi:hypothetical protein
MLTFLQRESNRIMSRVRVGVEWGFGQIRSNCPLIVKPEILKHRKGTVSLLMRNAVLLTNYRNHIGENPTSLYFKCPTSTLDNYLAPRN